MQQKKLDKMMAVARGKKVDPTDYVRPPSRITKPFKGPFMGGPSKIIKPYKGPKINRDDDLRQIGPRKKPKKTMPKQMGPKKKMKPKQLKRMGY